MIKFLLKGLIRDPSRSLFPLLTVILGVMLTVFLHSWIGGILGDVEDLTARFDTGHVKVVTRAYAENADQLPNDLALAGVNTLMKQLKSMFENVNWTQRIRFGGLIDVPDEKGETRSQGPAMGLAVDLLSPDSKEIERLNIQKSMVKGELPQKNGEIIISDEFAHKLEVEPGDAVTLISSAMYGSMAMHNFNIAGTISFGMEVLDRGSFIADIRDVRLALDMDNACSEILGFFESKRFNQDKAETVKRAFNEKYADEDDEFSPVMLTLVDAAGFGDNLELARSMSVLLVGLFVFVMSLVLWNTGLIGGLRRYGEIGVRLAVGEDKTNLYASMIAESIMIGIAGSLVGTSIGLTGAYIIQHYGIDFSFMMQKSSMMLPNVVRTKVTTVTYFIGFIPGLLSNVLGSSLAGIGIYKRQTAHLFKELET